MNRLVAMHPRTLTPQARSNVLAMLREAADKPGEPLVLEEGMDLKVIEDPYFSAVWSWVCSTIALGVSCLALALALTGGQ